MVGWRPGLAVSAPSWMRTWPGSGPTLALPLIMWPLPLCHQCLWKCVNITFIFFFYFHKYVYTPKLNLTFAAKMLSFIKRWLHIACLWSFSFKVLEKNSLIIRILLNLWLPSHKIEFTKSQSKSTSISPDQPTLNWIIIDIKEKQQKFFSHSSFHTDILSYYSFNTKF